MKNRLFFLIKSLGSAFMIFYILRAVELSTFVTTIQEADLPLLSVALLLHGVGYIISAYRWQRLLRVVNVHVKMGFLINSCMVATFFNNFLPTTIGGDMVRTHDTAHHTRSSMSLALAVIAVDRLTGMLALFLASLASFMIGFSLFGSDTSIVISLAITGGLFILIALLISRSPVHHKWISSLSIAQKIVAKLERFYNALLLYKQQRSEVFKSLLLGILLQINVILHYYLISQALHQNVSFLYFCLVIPLLILGLQVAPSINGIGYREAGFVLFLSKVGVSTASAVSLSFLALSMLLVWSVIGGSLFALRRERFDLNLLRTVLR
ncbi:MAG: flippase-like domain-containing protein [Caldilineaceae bacterium]|nr:flippase-like domain-containing protein [Caldilineaceae bacterium]